MNNNAQPTPTANTDDTEIDYDYLLAELNADCEEKDAELSADDYSSLDELAADYDYDED